MIKLTSYMASGKMSGFSRFLLWDYPRASWQYDIIVAIILAFIFLTPPGNVPGSAEGQQHRSASYRARCHCFLGGPGIA